MKVLDWAVEGVDATNEWVGRILSYAVLLMFVLVIMEVFLRYLFNSPTVWTNELTQLIFGAYIILSGGHILKMGGHVNVDILFSHLSPRGQAILNIITFPVFLAFGGMMLIYGWSLAYESMTIFEHSESAWNPPIYPVKMMIPLGAALLLLQGFVDLRKNITIVRTGAPIESAEIVEKETL
ncbi:MAG: TRAP transporter small permease subunit [Desulfarculaceae bacterium]|nr:TRAP transporter small permease subunit [Desulfarculaceae bacterium]MCF8072890.1 TRAP transporter small permease subunit [Desulfarculaceae bacterium]MCF8101058.1 TRAP transporter small permease subunit [Desulfarculaceae bacterium]MCF8115555.1 TRAP transporter small permease subunit [Desulfarculaceae bacterium]